MDTENSLMLITVAISITTCLLTIIISIYRNSKNEKERRRIIAETISKYELNEAKHMSQTDLRYDYLTINSIINVENKYKLSNRIVPLLTTVIALYPAIYLTFSKSIGISTSSPLLKESAVRLVVVVTSLINVAVNITIGYLESIRAKHKLVKIASKSIKASNAEDDENFTHTA
ncbi:hypothetical protein AGMMS49992_32140 [Clostridia bacterium]|nr:hypothetical protein AGMMS49992_32140 [Clostridia bacterium]